MSSSFQDDEAPSQPSTPGYVDPRLQYPNNEPGTPLIFTISPFERRQDIPSRSRSASISSLSSPTRRAPARGRTASPVAVRIPYPLFREPSTTTDAAPSSPLKLPSPRKVLFASLSFPRNLTTSTTEDPFITESSHITQSRSTTLPGSSRQLATTETVRSTTTVPLQPTTIIGTPPATRNYNMERHEGIIRWSPIPSRDEFMVLNLHSRIVQVYQANGHAQSGKFDYEARSKHTEIPPINTYDWSPAVQGLVAVGTSHGEVHLLRVDDDSNASITLPLKLQRSCQSVAFNTTGLLAVGLDRIRNDSCLQIWDVNQRLGTWDQKQRGWSSVPAMTIEPKKKLEGSISITSVRFFDDQPQTLVVGVKNQSVRIHDLRDPNSSVMQFTTRCNNNLAIDFADTNYFASSSLDQAGLVVWDRRVTSRSTASPMYLEAIDEDGVPWGAALSLNKVIEMEKGVHIKQLRYCREHRGMLGVLSSAGQLQVLKTNKEYIEPESIDDVEGSPELLEVKKSIDLEYACFDPNHQRKPEDRIVSFDWLNLNTPHLDPRIVGLRANGSFEVLQTPAASAGQLAQLIAWAPPRPLDGPYMTLMNFKDPNEAEKVLGPLYADAAKADIPVFGPNGFNNPETMKKLNAEIKEAIHSGEDPVVERLPVYGTKNNDVGASGTTDPPTEQLSQLNIENKEAKPEFKKSESSREMHDRFHYSTLSVLPAAKEIKKKYDNVMIQRAVNGYLFNPNVNARICREAKYCDDVWLVRAWYWVANSTALMTPVSGKTGMTAGPLDLSRMGVHPIWMNNLGEKFRSRIIGASVIPDAEQWETIIGKIKKMMGWPEFKDIEDIETNKPNHRLLCLATCGLLKPPEELEEDIAELIEDDEYTNAAAMALFEGLPDRAVELLKNADKAYLAFMGMALGIKLQSANTTGLDSGDWAKVLEKHPEMYKDPYLRAIYVFIASGDWAAIANEATLPMRDRVGVALRKLNDDQLTAWLEAQMEGAIKEGDIEAIFLSGITDDFVDICAKYVEKFGDYQSPILILSHCYPRYIDDIRCDAWRKEYCALLHRNQKHVLRVHFDQLSAKLSRGRDGARGIKPPPRQVTIRCLNCDLQTANDLANTGGGSSSAAGPSTTTNDGRSPLMAAGINAGLSCPKCGAHLPRCVVCLQHVGVPRSDKPELSNDPEIRKMAMFPSCCLKCKHIMHLDHATEWFTRHVECPVPECRCQCKIEDLYKEE